MSTLKELEPRAGEILAREQAAYERNNPKSREAYERSCRVLPGGVSRILCYFPPFPARRSPARGASWWTWMGTGVWTSSTALRR